MRRWVPCIFCFSLTALLCGVPAQAQSQSASSATGEDAALLSQPAEKAPSGRISGTVVDQTGTFVAGAHLLLTTKEPAPSPEVISDESVQFIFGGIAPGPFRIVVTSDGFATQVSSGFLNPGETLILPDIALAIASATSEVRVTLTRVEIAEAEIKAEEKQRVLGVVPNFYVTYVREPMPLTSHQKFELAWKSTIDPVSFGLTGAIAGIEQADNQFSGYGQGAQGYAKRFGASYTDLVTGTFIGGAILPSLLKQDPRYFYKGTGSKRSRAFYAMANAVICKGDNGHWQANYSSILGSLAAGGISNLYYPSQNRDGLELTFENALIGIGESAAVNLLQEFVMRRLTHNVPSGH